MYENRRFKFSGWPATVPGAPSNSTNYSGFKSGGFKTSAKVTSRKVSKFQINIKLLKSLSTEDFNHLAQTPLYLQFLRNKVSITLCGNDDLDYDTYQRANFLKLDQIRLFLEEEVTGLYFLAEDYEGMYVLMFENASDVVHFKLKFEGMTIELDDEIWV